MSKLAFASGCMGGLALALTVAACGGDNPITYSSPVGIELKADSDKVVAGAITDSKNITTESGNPYGAFTNTAKQMLGGKDPSRVEITKATLTLDTGMSTGVTKLDDIFTGDVSISFHMTDSNNTYVVGTITNPTGLGPDDVAVTFDGGQVSATDYPKFLNGSFLVVLTGTANPMYMGKMAKASVQATFTFEAFQ